MFKKRKRKQTENKETRIINKGRKKSNIKGELEQKKTQEQTEQQQMKKEEGDKGKKG